MSQLDLDLLLDSVTAETAEALEADTVAILLGDDAAVDDTAGHAMTSVLAVPLVVEGRTVGTAVAGRAGPSPFDEGAAEFLRLVADRVALAVDRARLFREAEATQRRLAFLTAAGEALARSLDGPTLLQTVVDQAVPVLADWCAVDFLADDGDFQCVAAAHRDPDLTPLVRELHDSRPPRIENARGVGRVARTGQSQFWPVVTEQGWAQVAQSPERLAMFRTLAPVSAVIVPLSVRGSMLGTISFIQSSSGRRYTEADLDLAQELVRRVALALDNARLFAERSQVARTLQASLLPPHLPDIPGLEVDGVFRPGGEGVEVGGDFYDVFLTEPGDWAMVVGDVCGKGAEAAAVTALGRYTLRAAAMQARRPSRVLHVLNEAMLRQDPGRPFLTVAYARVQLGDGPDTPV
ncbi:MAG TPA: GAF domain-containing protein, partial [Acidimicrobiales bacterium]|nr:GAF domain-containing protein [Acidimicrobiales bacterium]